LIGSLQNISNGTTTKFLITNKLGLTSNEIQSKKKRHHRTQMNKKIIMMIMIKKNIFQMEMHKIQMHLFEFCSVSTELVQIN
jgi:hypothetical protein